MLGPCGSHTGKMKTFTCHCGNRIYFENSQCLACGRALGFLPRHRVLSALEPEDGGGWRALHPAAGQQRFRQCANYAIENVCNWMIDADESDSGLCCSCELNLIIPNLSSDKNRVLWYRVESAKRRLLYTLMGLDLPVVGRRRDPEHGLAFEFMEDQPQHPEFSDPLPRGNSVITGHRTGIITINLAEADPSAREHIREAMGEQYRTLLGHFRHESGHYYWDRLVKDTPWLEQFRALFGDERGDYDSALATYYASGAAPDWQTYFISAYASAHPWEDWAETWAHYLHMVDTLETASDFDFAIHGRFVSHPAAGAIRTGQSAPPAAGGTPFDTLLTDWSRLTEAMNAVNRSMGMPDPYPFMLSARPVAKLKFVHQLIAGMLPG